MTDKTAGVGPVEREFVPLPEPAAWNCYWRGDNDSTSWDQWHDASDPMPERWYGEPPDDVTPHYTADQMHAYAAEQVAAERERLRALVEAVRDANAAAQGDDAFRLLTGRQQQAWDALMAALS